MRGRPLYSLVWGEAGVERMFGIFAEEVATTMRLLGVSKLDQLGLRHVGLSVARAHHVV